MASNIQEGHIERELMEIENLWRDSDQYKEQANDSARRAFDKGAAVAQLIREGKCTTGNLLEDFAIVEKGAVFAKVDYKPLENLQQKIGAHTGELVLVVKAKRLSMFDDVEERVFLGALSRKGFIIDMPGAKSYFPTVEHVVWNSRTHPDLVREKGNIPFVGRLSTTSLSDLDKPLMGEGEVRIWREGGDKYMYAVLEVEVGNDAVRAWFEHLTPKYRALYNAMMCSLGREDSLPVEQLAEAKA